MNPTLHKRSLCFILCLALFGAAKASRPEALEKTWRKGNTHAHTLWSDGNAAPELVVQYYREHGYSFLVLSDHNLLSRAEGWFPVNEGRLSSDQVGELRENFGEEWVETRHAAGNAEPEASATEQAGLEMRLKNLDQLRAKFQKEREVQFVDGALRIEINTRENESHRTEFIGTLRGHGATQIGVVLSSTKENPAIYQLSGAELYVRARVISSLDHPNPYAQGDKQMAWVQPVLPD